MHAADLNYAARGKLAAPKQLHGRIRPEYHRQPLWIAAEFNLDSEFYAAKLLVDEKQLPLAG